LFVQKNATGKNIKKGMNEPLRQKEKQTVLKRKSLNYMGKIRYRMGDGDQKKGIKGFLLGEKNGPVKRRGKGPRGKKKNRSQEGKNKRKKPTRALEKIKEKNPTNENPDPRIRELYREEHILRYPNWG